MDLASLWFLARYGIVGVIGGVLQTLTLYCWVDLFHLSNHYLWGVVFGLCIALIVTFTLQKYWTFRDHGHVEVSRQFLLYTCIALASLGLNILLLSASKLALELSGLNFFHVWYLLAQIIIIGIIAGLSFTANYFATFRTSP